MEDFVEERTMKEPLIHAFQLLVSCPWSWSVSTGFRCAG
jgi:hypothetical protein